MKKVILLDVDGTMIDYQKLYKLSSIYLIKNIFNMGLYRNIKAVLVLFTKDQPYMFADVFRNTFLDPQFYKNSLYPDVIPTIERLKRDGHKIGVWSEANFKKQMLKLSFSGILKYLNPEHILISSDKRSTLVDKSVKDSVLVIDDRVDIANFLKDKKFKYLLINRKNGVNKKQNHPVIKTLNELKIDY